MQKKRKAEEEEEEVRRRRRRKEERKERVNYMYDIFQQIELAVGVPRTQKLSSFQLRI